MPAVLCHAGASHGGDTSSLLKKLLYGSLHFCIIHPAHLLVASIVWGSVTCHDLHEEYYDARIHRTSLRA